MLRTPQENACARCMLKACICCLWCLEKCLNYLNQVGQLMDYSLQIEVEIVAYSDVLCALLKEL